MSVLIRNSLAAAAVLLAGTAQAAISVSIYEPSTSGISVLSSSQVGNTLSITTTWTSSVGSFLLFSGLESGVNYTIEHTISNTTGGSWTRFANELLDPAGQQNDIDRDPNPQPGFVPTRFSTSNDFDGLSFAQGSGFARTSSVFGSVVVDELSDARDFIDFYNGTQANGATDTFTTFGLRDNAGANQPFLLALRPNAFSIQQPVPEPETYAMMLLGLGVVGFIARRKQRAATA